MDHMAGCCTCTCCDVSSTCRTLDDAAPGLLLTAPADTARSRPAIEFILLRFHRRSPHSAVQLGPIGEKLTGTKVSDSELSSQTCRSVIQCTLSSLNAATGALRRHKQSKSCLGSHYRDLDRQTLARCLLAEEAVTKIDVWWRKWIFWVDWWTACQSKGKGRKEAFRNSCCAPCSYKYEEVRGRVFE